jgi:two-component system, cell cycle sensor histidine kinase and response regulator CckA
LTIFDLYNQVAMPDESESKVILVVDDEADVRKLVSAMVVQLGYKALTADSGDHALKLYQNLNREIDLLITDVIAPGMSGPMLADRMTALQPNLRVLYISGYDNTHVVQKYVVEKGHQLLSKPFTLDQLRTKLRAILPMPAGASGE